MQELEGRLLLIVIRMNLMHRFKFEIRTELQPVLSPAITCKNNFNLGIRFWLLPTIQPDNLPLLLASQKRKKPSQSTVFKFLFFSAFIRALECIEFLVFCFKYASDILDKSIPSMKKDSGF